MLVESVIKSGQLVDVADWTAVRRTEHAVAEAVLVAPPCRTSIRMAATSKTVAASSAWRAQAHFDNSIGRRAAPAHPRTAPSPPRPAAEPPHHGAD
ncbi:hypothetical protein, partial [Streptomyces graminilatus]|uniref:hypothetical protein n=1 Tax=Streptomyces graminilatus TaxID=1464070 RepID=UPI000B0D9867